MLSCENKMLQLLVAGKPWVSPHNALHYFSKIASKLLSNNQKLFLFSSEFEIANKYDFFVHIGHYLSRQPCVIPLTTLHDNLR